MALVLCYISDWSAHPVRADAEGIWALSRYAP
jgi:hypothetical protein